MRPALDLSRPGPSETTWSAALSGLSSFVWPDVERLVVVSPHPDDETFGAGGLIATAVQRALPVLVVCVTDGEAAFAHPDLGALRRQELTCALAQLGANGSVSADHLALPDGQVGAHTEELHDLLARRIGERDLVVCPVADDGHCDHDAVSDVATAVAVERGAALRWYPVWSWHCHRPERSSLTSAERLVLDPEARRAKQAAMRCYRSQLEGAEPVVPPMMLDRLDRSFEAIVTPSILAVGKPSWHE